MNVKKLETWVWVLIYGGLGLLMLGLWTLQREVSVGSWLAVAGAVGVFGGALLLWLRSRVRDDPH